MTETIAKPILSPIASATSSVEGHVMPLKGRTEAQSTTTSSEVEKQNLELKRLIEMMQKTLENVAPKEKEENVELRRGRTISGNWDWGREGVPIDKHPCFRLGAKALGFTESEAYAQQNDMADIVKTAIEFLRSSNPEHVYTFLSHFARHTDAKSLWAMRRELIRKISEEEEGENI